MGTVYGQLVFHIEHDITDRIGIRTLVLSKRWVASRWPMSIEETDEEVPAPPAMPGGMALIGRQTQTGKGGFRTMGTFEGVVGNGKDVTFKDRTNSIDYAFKPGFSQVSILRHPRFRQLQKDYNGFIDQDGQVYFPPTISGNTGSRGLGGDGGSSEKSNPMFDQTEFNRMEGTYSFRYASFSPGSEAHVGKIFSTGGLPGRPPNIGEGRNWLGAPTDSARRGPVFDIIENYWLSGEGGWPVPIYGNPGSPGSKGGLSTGGLSTGSL